MCASFGFGQPNGNQKEFFYFTLFIRLICSNFAPSKKGLHENKALLCKPSCTRIHIL